MSTYLERYKLMESAAMRRRAQVALWEVCVDVMNEPDGDPGRKTFAKKNLKGEADTDVLRRIMVRLTANATIGAAGEACDDSDIKFVVAGLVDELAA